MLASYASLIVYICKNKSEVVGNRLDEWKDYIHLHRLPEPRLKAGYFNYVVEKEIEVVK
ncbi:hypothetical protein [Bacillus mycoides]|uniref:hypothetical protein n=1 Tax=Bacillus mycoides TaxID=1405 RepID=UPI003D1EEF61